MLTKCRLFYISKEEILLLLILVKMSDLPSTNLNYKQEMDNVCCFSLKKNKIPSVGGLSTDKVHSERLQSS